MYRLILTLSILLMTCGCGHSVLVQHKLTGLALAVPIGDGQYLGLTIGSSEQTTATVRGGTTVETTSVAGGGIFSGDAGINHITTMKTNAQLNEGNVRDIMLSPECPDAAKIELAKNFSNAAQAPNVPPVVAQAQTAAIHSGVEAVTTNNVPMINRISGVDKIVGDTTSAVTSVVSSVTSTVTDVTNNVIDEVSANTQTTTNSVTSWFKSLSWSHFWSAVSVIALFLLCRLMFRKDKSSPTPVLNDTDPDTIQPEPDPEPTPVDGTDPPFNNNEEEVIDMSVEDTEPKPENKEETTKKEEKTPWYKKIWMWITFLYGLIKYIPKKQRDKILETVKKWITSKKKK